MIKLDDVSRKLLSWGAAAGLITGAGGVVIANQAVYNLVTKPQEVHAAKIEAGKEKQREIIDAFALKLANQLPPEQQLAAINKGVLEIVCWGNKFPPRPTDLDSYRKAMQVKTCGLFVAAPEPS